MNPYHFLYVLIIAPTISIAGIVGDCQNPDDFEGINRSTYALNELIDKHGLAPISNGYAKHTPSVLKLGVSNFFQNMNLPIVLVANILTLDIKEAATVAARFLTNSTFGVLGLVDFAGLNDDLNTRSDDIGMSLARYGLFAGEHLEIPILGPSNVRHLSGTISSGIIEAGLLTAIGITGPVAIGYATFKIIDARTGLAEAINMRNELAIDRYNFTKSMWCQNRDNTMGIPNLDLEDDW